MGLRDLIPRIEVWKDVHRWSEPSCYRVRLRGDLPRRLVFALACGAILASVLMVLFAINVRPPHPLWASFGFLIAGAYSLLILLHGESNASGRVRICHEGMIRKRLFVPGAPLFHHGMEERSWPYAAIRHCSIVPGHALAKNFSVLMVTDDDETEIVGIPSSIELRQFAEFLASKGLQVTVGSAIPTPFSRRMSLPVASIAGLLGLAALFASSVFYGISTFAWRHGEPDSIAQSFERPHGFPDSRRSSDHRPWGIERVPAVEVRPPESPPVSSHSIPEVAEPTQPTSSSTSDSTGKPPVNLLSLIDPGRDQVRGSWSVVEGNLFTPRDHAATLVIPYAAPKDYRLTVIAERTEGVDSLCLGLTVGGRQTMLALEGWGMTASGLNTVNGRTADNNETTFRSQVFLPRMPSTIVCIVRNNRVQVSCNGQQVLDWAGDVQQLDLDRRFWSNIPDDKLFVGSWGTTFRISRLELVPLSPDGSGGSS